MSQALLLRHGESAHNAHTGSEALGDEEGDRLTERGLHQAHAAGLGLAVRGVTQLWTSPMRRAAETAAAVGTALGLEPATLPYVHELSRAESFEDLVARVRRLKAELESPEPGELPLVVGHGIFIRFFLLDSILGDEFAPPMAAGIWNLGSHNCGLSLFAHGETRDPSGTEVPGWTCLSWMQRPWDPP
ncbi:MAG TPA: histidine phosphatase family protein [Solirubrobacterales bacterium]|jgi:broad specificity phosphatase PhoE|nr:histidine phosphatase family protein [Solirubrobacterales bacterium]